MAKHSERYDLPLFRAALKVHKMLFQINELHEQFPGLRAFLRRIEQTARQDDAFLQADFLQEQKASKAGNGRRKRKKRTAAQRAAVSKRMKAYWSKRKAEKS